MSFSQLKIIVITDNSKLDKNDSENIEKSFKVPTFSDFEEYCTKLDEKPKYKECNYCKLKITCSNIKRHENNHCKNNPNSNTSKKYH
jgi:hypothetical protein